MLSFRVKLVPKYLFTLIQVVPLTLFCLHRQSQYALPFVFVQSVNCVTLIYVIIIWFLLSPWACVNNIFSC